MKDYTEQMEDGRNVLKGTADLLFAYLRDTIYDPTHASLNPQQLPQEFQDFARGLLFFNHLVHETSALAKELANGNLNCELPAPSNEIAAPLKMLHASLKHLTWQTQQVAKGDYRQHVDFMGDFSEAFNNMIKQLEQRRKSDLDEKTRLERYVDLMLVNCPDPVLLFDRDGRLAYVSESFLECCAIYESYSIRGKPLRDLLMPVVAEEFLCYIEGLFEIAFLEKRTVKTDQEIDFGHNGSRRHYQIQITPMLDAEGEAEGVMMLFHDMTEIVRAQREAERAREHAEQSSRAKSDFLARMSHEMRTPMNAIIGMATVYGNSSDPKRKDYCVEKIDVASRHLLGVINDVLDMSKIEADKLELTSGGFSFQKMIEHVLSLIIFRAEERGQHLVVNLDPELPEMIITDEQRLSQVITNLLSNAVKFTPDGGEISLIAEKTDDEERFCIIRITVRDNGIGISDEQQKRLFEAFEQADGSISRRFGGTGLGLAISKRIVEMIGGAIWVEAEPNKGAAFTFEIPVEKAILPSDSMSTQVVLEVDHQDNQNGTESEEGIFLGCKVLLAEDVELNREVLAALLEHTGIELDEAHDGLMTVEKFTATPQMYDLILMDIHMPHLDGYEATRRIRSSGLPGAESIPIVAMTANVFREDIERCLASGMNSHLGKPIDARQVIAQLKEYLPKASQN